MLPKRQRLNRALAWLLRRDGYFVLSPVALRLGGVTLALALEVPWPIWHFAADDLPPELACGRAANGGPR